MNSEEDLLARIVAATDIGLQDISDLVYENMLRRYGVCVEVTGRHIEPFFVRHPRITTTYTKQQKWESSTCDVEVFWL